MRCTRLRPVQSLGRRCGFWQLTEKGTEFAGSVERIVLVDGRKLADLMIEFEVGVSSRAVRIPKVDSDYFEE